VGLAAINTGNNMLYLVLGMLLSIIALNGFLSESTVKKISIEGHLPSWVFVGDSISSYVTLRNQKRFFPSFLLRVSHLWVEKDGDAKGKRILDPKKDSYCLQRDGFITKIRAGQEEKVRIESKMNKRGIYHLQGYKLATRFPFGLFDKSRELKDELTLAVYPKPKIADLWSDEKSSGVGEQMKNFRGMGGDLYALREYHRDEDSRFIHWKLSAKTGRLIIQEHSSTSREKALIYFDTRQKDPKDRERFDQAVSHVSYLINQAFEGDYEVGLWTPEASFEANQGDRHFHKMMTYLAKVKPFGEGLNSSEKNAEDFQAFASGASFQGEGNIYYIRAETRPFLVGIPA
jgi:uncharacterized protein (DUF58 family)